VRKLNVNGNSAVNAMKCYIQGGVVAGAGATAVEVEAIQ
jgi:hypothetical protein